MDTSRSEDTRAITNLMHIYSELVDYARFDELGKLFKNANVFMPGDVDPTVAAGSGSFGDVLKEWVILDPKVGTPRTRHLTTNHIIEFDSDTSARTRSGFTVMQQTDTFPLQTIIVGEYHDRFEKTEQGWIFTERREKITLAGDLSAHLRFPAPDVR